jgi:hypothetical protein
MLYAILIAALLVAATVFVRAAGFSVVLRFLMKSHAAPPSQPWPIAWLLIRTTWMLILIHLVEIAVWGSFYLWKKCLPDAESAFYFSGVTYTSVGYGDLVLTKPWRMLAPVEALTGILMCGLSAALFFATLTRISASRFQTKLE